MTIKNEVKKKQEHKYKYKHIMPTAFLTVVFIILFHFVSVPTLAKQKAVRGIMPYWATTAIATPLGFLI